MAGQMANAIERVSETFSFAKKIPMLMKATSDDDSPTSGYLYQEINSITYESISSCNSLLDFLVGRLKKQSPNVKYKVLKILCYVGSNGHSEFRSALRHKADVLREAESFTGQMDYLRGDALNQRVRAAASELIELLFNVESSGNTTMRAMMGPTGKKMEGFGNSPSPPAKSNTWLDSVKNLAERLPDAANRLTSKTEKESNMPTTGGSSVTFVNYAELSNPSSGFKTFVDDEDYHQSPVDQESSESEVKTLSVEGNLVDNITSEGGIRTVPSKEALNQFTKRCSTLNINKVLEAINNRLLEPVTEVQLKSLHVLEHLLKSDIPQVASKMSHCCTNLQELAKTESGNVLSKAKKIILLINAKIEKEKVQQDVDVKREEKSEDLLNVKNEGDNGNLFTQQVEADDTPTLFSGMSLHAKAEATSRSQPFDPFTTVPEKRSSTEVLDVFQGLDLSSGNHTPNNDRNSRQVFQGSKSELDNLFAVTKGTAGPSLTRKIQEPVKDSVTDLFDPLCNGSVSTFGLHVTQPSVISSTGAVKERSSETTTNIKTGPQLMSYENSFIAPQDNVVGPSNVNSVNPRLMNTTGASHAFDDLDGLSRNSTTQPHVTLPSSGPPMGNQYSLNFPNNSHPIVQPSVLSGVSTIPLRLPKQPSQKTDFSFVGKSGKADAFSFVQDEMKARK